MGCDDGGRHVGGWVDGGKAAAERKVRGESVKITVFSAPNLETLDFILRCVLISCPQHSLYSKAFLGFIIKQAFRLSDPSSCIIALLGGICRLVTTSF